MFKKFFLILTTVFISVFSSPLSETSDYDAVKNALTQRDDLFTRVLGNYQKEGYPAPDVIRSRLASAGGAQTPWYYLLEAETIADPEGKKRCYRQALEAAGTDIGGLWGLFLEYHKRGEAVFQDAVLDKMEKIQLESGVEVLPAISGQLKLLAQHEYAHHRNDNAQYFLKQVKRFSEDTYTAEATSLFTPGTHVDFFTVQNHFSDKLKSSWKTQARTAQTLFHVLGNLFTIITLFLFFMLIIRFYDKAIHPLTCLYPLSVPYRMRFIFTTLIIIIASVFGIYPVAVILTILLMRVNMSKFDMLIARITAVLLLLMPLNSIVDSKFGHILSDKSPFILYEKALYGQPTPALYSEIKALSEKAEISSKEKALHLTSMALIQFKRGSTNAAVSLIREAHTLWPVNESVLMAAGNIYHGFGDTDQAFKIFKAAIDSFPESPEINYNYGQINLEKVGITDGTTYISKGAQLSPRIVNGFIKRNSQFFGELEWPVFRKYFMGTVSAKTFWNNFMEFSTPPAGTLQKYWGAAFFGFPIEVSIGIIIAMYIISSLIVPTHMQMKKTGECVLCGKPVCRKCRANDYCSECQAVLQNISNESLVSALKIKIADSKRIGILTKAHISDIIFPGTRDFFLKKKSRRRAAVLLPLTFICYMAILFFGSLDLTLFPAASRNISALLISPACIYLLIFLIVNVRALIPALVKGNR